MIDRTRPIMITLVLFPLVILVAAEAQPMFAHPFT